MPVQAERLKAERIEQGAALARQRLGAAQAERAVRFLRAFAENVAPEEILAFAPEDLYGAAMSLLALAAERPPGTALIRVHTPAADADGWSSRHTVIEIVNDDMPFLVDSVTAELQRLDAQVLLVIHPIVTVTRDPAGRLVAIDAAPGEEPGGRTESMMHIAVTATPDARRLDEIRAQLAGVLDDVRAAVSDWRAMRARLAEARAALAAVVACPPEVPAFLDWLDDHHFTFLGCRDYVFDALGDDGASFAIAPGSGLGVLRDEASPVFDGLRRFAALPDEVRQYLRQPEPLVLTKASHRARVHRPIPMDVVGVKRFAADGTVTGIRVFAGLLTSSAYSASARAIPILRDKVERVLARFGFDPASHDGKALLHILESYPRDELFQVSEDELFVTARGILHLEGRPRIALFVRRDPFERFVSCLVFAPRDRYDTELRRRMQAVLSDAFAGEVVSFATQIGDSPLARVHFVISTTPGEVPAFDPQHVEALLSEAGRSWQDRLKEALDQRMGEAEAIAALRRYADAFPPGYTDRFGPATAVLDMDRIDATLADGTLGMNLFRPVEAAAHEVRFKIYHAGGQVALSDVLPMLENLGLRVLSEIPDAIRPAGDGPTVWIHDFGLATRDGTAIDPARLRDRFHDAFRAVWTGAMHNDRFNQLVLRAGLAWPEVVVLRTYGFYLRQAAFPFSQAYIEDTLIGHPTIARRLVDLFNTRFDPAARDGAPTRSAGLVVEIEHALDAVETLDEDRILRALMTLIRATLRTNHFQRATDGGRKDYLSVKLDSQAIDFLPAPRPHVEIFVQSPRMEGIHLRGGKVARGGIRWSDRREDYRTEILGLMKAQMVKNAVIVPVGSKGGFIVKQPPAHGGREALRAEVVHCYETLMRGLLDLTDNLVEGRAVPPSDVVRLDDDDPYLVVAADKGTATFSDIANAISAEYGFWLGDAFASGGSQGYDHKAMAITARGAWEAVKRHFRELGQDIQSTDVTVVGVGDMSGDVFGNGMLLSPHIRLVAAFDHRHIFVDPDPDAERSLAERRRLFELPRSSWNDYDRALLSPGGGIFERSAKSVEVTPAMRLRFGLARERMTPSELIQALLRAEADLLWFGGIGTFVKAAAESHAEVGDKANDALRVDAHEVRARVIGEGANLGVTQRGRIAYAETGAGGAGGRINTDAIDNSAGVATSDREVNLKILLGAVMAQGDVTLKQRDRLLTGMTDEVAALVLRDNYLQPLALTLEEARAERLIEAHRRTMSALGEEARLDRAIEFLPDDGALAARAAAGRGLTRPELAVLLAYAKIAFYNGILASDLPDDPDCAGDLFDYFPAVLRERFAAAIEGHRLKREIVATVITNALVNRAGISFPTVMRDRIGAGPETVARAWLAARALYGLEAYWAEIEALDGLITSGEQTELYWAARSLVEETLPDLARRTGLPGTCVSTASHYRAGIERLLDDPPALLPPGEAEGFAARVAALAAAGVPAALARRAAAFDLLGAALAIVDLAEAHGIAVDRVARLHFAIGARFQVPRLVTAAGRMAADSAWQKRAVTAAVDDLRETHRALTAQVLAAGRADSLDAWLDGRTRAIERVDRVLAEVAGNAALDLAMVTVASRTLRAAIDA